MPEMFRFVVTETRQVEVTASSSTADAVRISRPRRSSMVRTSRSGTIAVGNDTTKDLLVGVWGNTTKLHQGKISILAARK
jgi:hypothetical protein